MWEKDEAEYLEKIDDLVHNEKKERDSWSARQQDIEVRNEIESRYSGGCTVLTVTVGRDRRASTQGQCSERVPY
jgi:hypothetical protein